ncbi:UDP-N-acetylglucosamine--N-acetylmuramyl-(pentapeptide) pyrophosphoryl-UDP N-acetylglucosamine transferase [Opitutaceae bacterium TAV5]|nr:UDP-N-acetylglucosamine--N-acetylmuramyl-(pentapeptide) pyrophosphoryl-UDP N-acetylglucosamine transferase [Opitutaceae bacterium TAV5]
MNAECGMRSGTGFQPVSVASPSGVARASSPCSGPPPLTFLILCGGTGGHLTPGIALAEGLIARGHRPLLLVSHKQIDARLLAKYPRLAFEKIPGAPLSFSPVPFLRFAASQTRAFLAGLRLVRRHRPAIVVGFGGFTTASVIVAARLFRVPVALHESNRVPGRAVRLLARLAQRIYLPPGIRIPSVRPGKQREAGLPVRAEIAPLPRAEARAALGLDPHAPAKLLAIFGGSQGASALNDWARRHAPDLARLDTGLYCVTGPGKETGGPASLPDSGSGIPNGSAPEARYVPFCDNVAALLSAADLVIARAGAGTLAEFIRCATPSILVPYPHAADNHQAANAAWLAGHEAALVIPQERLAADLLPAAESLLADDARRAALADALRRLDRARPLDQIIADLETLARR